MSSLIAAMTQANTHDSMKIDKHSSTWVTNSIVAFKPDTIDDTLPFNSMLAQSMLIKFTKLKLSCISTGKLSNTDVSTDHAFCLLSQLTFIHIYIIIHLRVCQ